jgi:hypothetical protein
LQWVSECGAFWRCDHHGQHIALHRHIFRSWNGDGTNGIQYNSCWANLENDLHYQVVSSREEMY